MQKIKTCAVLAPALMLLACGGPQTPQAQETPTPAVAPNASEPSPAANGADDGGAAPTMPELTPEAERSETGARDVLLGFARSIEQRQFGAAWALLSPADQRKWSRSAFTALFADLGQITVAVTTGQIEGAAGSAFYTAPVTITGPDEDGRPVRYEGKAVLRRINDIDGTTPAQQRWHFETLTLDWTH